MIEGLRALVRDQRIIIADGHHRYETALHYRRLLQAESLSVQDIIKVTVWLTDTADFGGFNAAYSEFFGDHRPARSTVRSDLMLPGARVEIEAIAAY